MENWQIEMEDKLDNIKNDVKEIKDALIGNSLTKNKGYFDKLTDLELEVSNLKMESNKNKLILSVAMFLGTIIGFIIEMIVQWLSNKK